MRLRRTWRAKLLEESLEAPRRDEAREPARCHAKVTVGVQDFAWRKNRRALPGDERFPAHRPFIFAFENLKHLVLAMMDMRWRTAARHVVRFDPASLLLHFDLAHHPEVLVREVMVGRLSVGRKRHLAVQEIMPRRKVSPEPNDAADVVTVERAA